jgi:hypothetical protein
MDIDGDGSPAKEKIAAQQIRRGTADKPTAKRQSRE